MHVDVLGLKLSASIIGLRLTTDKTVQLVIGSWLSGTRQSKFGSTTVEVKCTRMASSPPHRCPSGLYSLRLCTRARHRHQPGRYAVYRQYAAGEGRLGDFAEVERDPTSQTDPQYCRRRYHGAGVLLRSIISGEVPHFS